MDWLTLAKEKELELIENLRGILAIPSLLDEDKATEKAPFGPEIRRALDHMLNMAKMDGFKVTDVDGYAGIIEYGEGDEIIGVLGHLDIVPIGEGWSKDPFAGEIDKGYIFGRGAIDDKGPTIAAYEALKIFKEQNIQTNKKIYLILGCDEETGMRCMDYYKKHAPIPARGFVPDADFPVIYGEKGILNVELKANTTTVIKKLVAGERPNIVIGRASATVSGKAHKELFEFYLSVNQLTGTVEEVGMETTYSIEGVFAHGATPQFGVNSAVHLLNFIGTAYQDEFAKTFAQLLSDYRGTKLNIDFNGAHMGELTMNVGIVKIEDQKEAITLDIRYPNDTSFETIMENIKQSVQTASFPIQVEVLAHKGPLFNDPNSELIKILDSSYRKYSGDNFSPLKTMGGGTYARSFENFAAFGPEFTHEPIPSFVGAPHQKDEAAKIEDLVKACAIYADAMYQLTR